MSRQSGTIAYNFSEQFLNFFISVSSTFDFLVLWFISISLGWFSKHGLSVFIYRDWFSTHFLFGSSFFYFPLFLLFIASVGFASSAFMFILPVCWGRPLLPCFHGFHVSVLFLIKFIKWSYFDDLIMPHKFWHIFYVHVCINFLYDFFLLPRVA